MRACIVSMSTESRQMHVAATFSPPRTVHIPTNTGSIRLEVSLVVVTEGSRWPWRYANSCSGPWRKTYPPPPLAVIPTRRVQRIWQLAQKSCVCSLTAPVGQRIDVLMVEGDPHAPHCRRCQKEVSNTFPDTCETNPSMAETACKAVLL